MTTKNTPSHIICQVIEREGKKSIWSRIGAAWMHQDGEGFSLSFNAIPLTGSVVLRKYDPTKKNIEEKGE